MREREPDPVRPDEHLLPAAEAPRRAERALQAQRRRRAAPDQRSALTGYSTRTRAISFSGSSLGILYVTT